MSAQKILYVGAVVLEETDLLARITVDGNEFWIRKAQLVEPVRTHRRAAAKPKVVGRRNPATKKIIRYEARASEITETAEEEIYAED